MHDISFTEVFSTGYFSIEASDLVFPCGEPYYRLCHADSAIVCVMNDDGHFILVRQFRPNLGCHTLEFPAGSVEVGENAIKAASREFVEETGMSCNLEKIGKYRVLMNRTQNFEHVFFGIHAKQLSVEVHEKDIEVLSVPRSEFVELVLAGEFQQLAAVGILQIASLRLGVDVMKGSTSEIVDQFHSLYGEGVSTGTLLSGE